MRLLSTRHGKFLAFPIAAVALLLAAPASSALEPIPDKLVVLTFDDSVKSHFTVVRPLLLQHGFGATFFISEGWDFRTNKQDYMSWEEIALLHKDGFEIGNHTRSHLSVSDANVRRYLEELQTIADHCREHGIPEPTSFAYPGNAITTRALPVLRQHGIRFARRGGAPEFPYEGGRGTAYEPGLDHPLLVPTAGDARPDWSITNFVSAAEQARHGRIAVLQFHGVPDRAHPWVNTPPERFRGYISFLATNGYKVIALRDLSRYVDPSKEPADPMAVIEARKERLKTAGAEKAQALPEARPPKGDADLRFWLENMVTYHGFSPEEVRAATGMTRAAITAALERFKISATNRPRRAPDAPLLVLPYPGGRHPRIGFLDGAVDPQRETKVSVFTPWDEASYVVVDVPEAIWSNLGLTYLAHTHVPTVWSKQNITLPRLEWNRRANGDFDFERALPNGIVFGAKVSPARDAVHMELWLRNGSDKTLSDLRVQNCVMLKGAAGFTAQTNANKVFANPYVAVHSEDRHRWIITAWEPCHRPWANAPVPCLHSDPKFPDCPPGDTRRLRGWLSFYTGDDIQAELRRIDATGWKMATEKN